MNTSNIEDLFKSYSLNKWNGLFPNTKLNDAASFKMGCCVGFIYGLKLGGNTEAYEYFANNFIRVFTHPWLTPTDLIDSDRFVFGYENKPSNERYQKISRYITELYDDGTPLSFSFAVYIHNGERNRKTFGFNNDPYGIMMSGGVIFHGIGQTYSVTLDNKPGWQIHT